MSEHGTGRTRTDAETAEMWRRNARDAYAEVDQLRARLAEVERELAYANAVIASHGQVECGHISEGTGDEPDRCRICVAEQRLAEVTAALGTLITAMERATFHAQDREWARSVTEQARATLRAAAPSRRVVAGERMSLSLADFTRRCERLRGSLEASAQRLAGGPTREPPPHAQPQRGCTENAIPTDQR